MLIFERFEGNTAVIENDDRKLEVGREKIDSSVCEGDVLIQKNGMYFPDKNETEKRRKEILDLQNSLW